jgi:signal transduction histidine kinase
MEGATGPTGRGLRYVLAGLLVVGTAASGWLGWEVRNAEDAGIRRATQEQVEEVVDDLRWEMEARVDALARMADRWVVAGGTPEALWRTDTRNYIDDYDGFWAIDWVTPDGRVAWREPDNADVIGRDLGAEPLRRAAMDTSRRTGAPAVATPVDLFTGGTGVLVFVPLGAGAADGWLLGVFRLADLMRATERPVRGYEVTAYDAAGVVFTSASGSRSPFCATRPLSSLSEALQVEVCASPAFVAERRGLLPAVTVLTGLAFTLLAAALLHALESARARTAEARSLAASLSDHAAALEVAQRDVTDLSYSMSHELRTPLRAIDGHAALLAETAPESVLPSLARIRGNAQRMGKQLDGILELFRVIRRELDVQEIDVTALAHACLANHVAAEPGRPVDARIAEGLVVRGDPQLVRVVVAELIGNAWRFSARRDRVSIEVGASPRGFFVKDAGIGFDMAYAQKLFQAFERLHAPGEFEGLGLGLAIAARAAARHGARIRAEGRPGEGAVFWVDWP